MLKRHELIMRRTGGSKIILKYAGKDATYVISCIRVVLWNDRINKPGVRPYTPTRRNHDKSEAGKTVITLSNRFSLTEFNP